MALSNTSLANTFNQWRVNTNLVTDRVNTISPSANTISANSVTSNTVVINSSITLPAAAISAVDVAFLANTNSYIATKLDSSSYTTSDVQAKAALANTNAYIATKMDSSPSSFVLSANNPLFRIQDLDADSSIGPVIELYRDSPSPAVNDAIGVIDCYGEDDGGNKTLYARIRGSIEDATDGTEEGCWFVQSLTGGIMRTYISTNDGSGGSTRLYYANTSGNSQRLITTSSGVTVSGEIIANYADINGTADISGILSLHANTTWEDGDRLLIGTGSDLQIYHDGTDSYIVDSGTGNLKIAASQIDLLGGADGAETMATFVDNGAVSLYHNNNKKFETTANGAVITGDLQVSGQAWSTLDTLSDGATISWDLSNQVAQVTLGGNRTLDVPTNMKAGASYTLIIKQDGTGSRTLAFANTYLFEAGATPTLSTDPDAVDILTFISDGTNMYGVASLDFS